MMSLALEQCMLALVQEEGMLSLACYHYHTERWLLQAVYSWCEVVLVVRVETDSLGCSRQVWSVSCIPPLQ